MINFIEQIITRKDYLMRNKNNRKIRQFNFQRQDRKVSLTKITKYVEDLYTAKTREFLGRHVITSISHTQRPKDTLLQEAIDGLTRDDLDKTGTNISGHTVVPAGSRLVG